MKYTKAQLKKMATDVLYAQRTNDEKYFVFCMAMMLATGCSQLYLEQKIQEYANE